MRRTCPNCLKVFNPEDIAAVNACDADVRRIKYCSTTCERQMLNARYYKTHKTSIIKRILRNRKRAKRATS